jgi:hypothetical protein
MDSGARNALPCAQMVVFHTILSAPPVAGIPQKSVCWKFCERSRWNHSTPAAQSGRLQSVPWSSRWMRHWNGRLAYDQVLYYTRNTKALSFRSARIPWLLMSSIGVLSLRISFPLIQNVVELGLVWGIATWPTFAKWTLFGDLKSHCKSLWLYVIGSSRWRWTKSYESIE